MRLTVQSAVQASKSRNEISPIISLNMAEVEDVEEGFFEEEPELDEDYEF